MGNGKRRVEYYIHVVAIYEKQSPLLKRSLNNSEIAHLHLHLAQVQVLVSPPARNDMEIIG